MFMLHLRYVFAVVRHVLSGMRARLSETGDLRERIVFGEDSAPPFPPRRDPQTSLTAGIGWPGIELCR